ncbi:MAG: DUF3579 domain-containing protein [Gallionella sp.]
MSDEISEWVILGLTESDEMFDVPNWPELLCGMMAHQTTDHRYAYSEYLKPAHIGGYPAVVVLNQLAKDDPAAFAIIKNFVAENRLRTRAGRSAHRSDDLPLATQPERRQYIKG